MSITFPGGTVPTKAEFDALAAKVAMLTTQQAALAAQQATLAATQTTQGGVINDLGVRVARLEAAVVVPPTPGTPGVPSLSVVSVTPTSVTLTLLQVADGTGQPANYELRYAPGTIVWGSAVGTVVLTSFVGQIGAPRTVVVNGLLPGTAYQFQVVAYRGTLGVDAVFGDLSSVVTGLTPGMVVPPPSSGFHEPPGLALIDTTDWTADVGPWWRNFISADKPITTLVVTDGPNGIPSSVLQIGYLAGLAGGGGTELGRWIQPGVQELYWRYRVRVNPTWQGHTSGINKMVYINDAGSSGAWSAIWYVMYGGGSSPLGFYAYNQSGQDIGWVGTQQTPIFSRGDWHLVEIHQRQGQPGQIRVWIDDVLRLDTPAVTKPNPIGLIVISGIWGGVGDAKQHDDWMQFGPVYVSGR